MFKKMLIAAMVMVLVLDCAGCSGTWRRKFVRKKQDEKEEEPVLQPTDYKKQFTNKQLYANHFAFWKNSESEMIIDIGANNNQKRIRTYAAYSLAEIKEMQSLLVEEKKAQIAPYIEELKGLIAKINDSDYVTNRKNALLDQLRKHHRAVDRIFSYYSMQDYILQDTAAPAEKKSAESE